MYIVQLEDHNGKLTFMKPIRTSTPNPMIPMSSAQAMSLDIFVGFVFSQQSFWE